MSRNIALAKRLREVLLDGKFIANTNFKEQLDGISWKQAIQKVEGLNSVALLTFHIDYYLEGIIQVFQGGSLDIRDKYSFDLPDITSEAQWLALVGNFVRNAEKFIWHVEQLDDSIFDQAFTDEKYGTYLRNIDGVIEHSYYHLGQIVIIKKMILK